MKNEIGRKITSLTLMTIMFAGGMTLAVPGFLPDSAIPIPAFADRGTTEGMLYISSTAVSGPQVIELIVSDPASSATGGVLEPLTMDLNSTTVQLTQVQDGTWRAYFADLSAAVAADALSSTSFEFGTKCASTLVATGTGEGLKVDNATTFHETNSCTDPNAGTKTAFNVLDDAPEYSHPALRDDGSGTVYSGATYGQIGHDLYSAVTEKNDDSWPFIYGIELGADNFVEYGDDRIMFTYGEEGSGHSISTPSGFVVPGEELQLTIDDNALNLDPTTTETWTLTTSSTKYTGGQDTNSSTDMDELMAGAGFAQNTSLGITDSGTAILNPDTASTHVFIETGDNTGVFTTFDDLGNSTTSIAVAAAVDDTATLSWGLSSHIIHVATSTASSSLNAGAEWVPAEAASYSVSDPDMDRQAIVETLDVQTNNIIPTIKTGTLAKFLDANAMAGVTNGASGLAFASSNNFSDSATTCVNLGDESYRVSCTLAAGSSVATSVMTVNTGWNSNTLTGSEVFYYDVCSIAENIKSTAIAVTIDGDSVLEPSTNSCSGEISYLDNGTTALVDQTTGTTDTILTFTFTTPGSTTGTAGDYVIAADLMSFDQGVGANGIYRMEAVETGASTGVFEGTVSYVFMNTAAGETDAAGYIQTDGADLIIMLDNYATGSSAPRVNYGDTDVLDAKNVTVGAQLDANTHSGVVSFDENSYAVGDAATVTIVDADLNTDSTLVERYYGEADGTTLAAPEIFIVTCDDGTCTSPATVTVIEDGPDSDTFIGVFTVTNDIGKDLELGYSDSRDATGVATIWYATSTIGSETGTISLDRQVYPVPFGVSGVSGCSTDFCGLKTGAANDLADWNGSSGNDTGTLTVWVTVTDTDFTDDQLKATSAPGTCSTIASGTTTNVATFGANTANASATPKEIGPMNEVEQGSNMYEISFTIDETENSVRVYGGTTILQCEYADAAGDNGEATTVYDSSTFDLRNGTISTDKSVYIMGQDMVITLTDEDLNLDSDSAETYVLDLIEWDSDANSSILLSTTNTFTNNPTTLEETGDSTGVFQTLTTIPTWMNPNNNTGTAIELGEVITLTYRDAGRAGEASYASQKSADTTSVDVEHTISISNFGATITLDKTVYDWTDVVNIEVIAPDHNKNSNAKENIGTASLPVKISTRAGQMCPSTYTLKESGEDTGIFEGYLTLTGLPGQANNGGDTQDTIANVCTGPESGKLQTAGQDDGVTVTYEYNDGSVALASAIIQWNYSSIEFLDSSVAANGTTVIRVVDPDEDLLDTVVDQVTVDVYSDSDSGGITKVLSETDESTGIFEGTITLTSNDISTGDILRVSEGDTVTAEVTDTNLPGPDYTSSDTLLFAATTTVGTAFPPLERAPATSARVVDASGNSVAEVSVDQQVQIAADVTNGQSKDQAFAYLVQVQDASGVTVSLSWLSGSLTAGQSLSPAQSWTPTNSGSYTATVFVWESVSNPTALSPTVTVNIDVV